MPLFLCVVVHVAWLVCVAMAQSIWATCTLVYSYIHVRMIVCAPLHVLRMVGYKQLQYLLLLICVRLFTDIPMEKKKKGGQTNDASKENWP